MWTQVHKQSLWWLQYVMNRFKADRLQIIVVAKKYICVASVMTTSVLENCKLSSHFSINYLHVLMGNNIAFFFYEISCLIATTFRIQINATYFLNFRPCVRSFYLLRYSWYFIDVYIINRILHARLWCEFQSFRVQVDVSLVRCAHLWGIDLNTRR